MPGFIAGLPLSKVYIGRTVIYGIALPLLRGYVIGLKKQIPGNLKVMAGIVAFIFSQFVTLGRIYSFSDSFDLYGSCWLSSVLWLLQSVAWLAIFYPMVCYVVWWFENCDILSRGQDEGVVNYRRIFYVALLIRLILFGFFYPCLYDYDAAFALRTMLRPGEVLSNHHPYFIQLIHKCFYDLGVDCFGRPDVGMAILTLLWIGISIGIVIYTLKVLQSFAGNAKVTTIVGYLFALFPVFPILSVYITKDGFFAYGFLLYTACLLQLYVSKGECIKNLWFLLMFLASMIVLCFARNQGIYFVVIETGLLLFVYRKYCLQVLLICAMPIVLCYWVNHKYYPSINVEDDSPKEANCMPFQQTARYLKTYPNDVTEEELSSIKAILITDSIVEYYLPYLCDPVKQFYFYGKTIVIPFDSLQHFPRWNHQGESEVLGKYHKSWLSMMLRHPDAYFDAQLSVIYPFFYSEKCNLIYIERGWENSTATRDEYSFFHATYFKDKMCNMNIYLSRLPIFELIFRVYFYVWMSVFGVIFLIWKRDWRGISVFLPTILSILLLILCPVATTRYVFPILVTNLLLFVYLLKVKL
ncbi:MAG: hypothetical protein J1E29_07680 [Duncaniella sp.]|nr:hypothetical protein [Duncaniella sp.]